VSEDFIRAEKISKRYGEVLAVDAVDVSVHPGEVVALAGANGAGKSTAIRIIAGITQPDAGRVLIRGEDLAHKLPTTKQRLGYLPEDLILYDGLTGEEYLELVAGLKRAEVSQIATEISFFELDKVRHKLVGGYSLGMRKKLGLAAAFVGSPSVIILDEPLNGLDVEMMKKLRLRIAAEREAGRSILLSSHVMSFVERVCDRVAIMKAGKFTATGSPLELRRQARLPDADFEDVFFRLAT
jgi:Cu-processing system ATP-binding protein